MKVLTFRNLLTKAMHKAMEDNQKGLNFTQAFIEHVVKDCLCSKDTAKKLVFATTYFATPLKLQELYFEGEKKYLAFDGCVVFRTVEKPAECIIAEELGKVFGEL